MGFTTSLRLHFASILAATQTGFWEELGEGG